MGLTGVVSNIMVPGSLLMYGAQDLGLGFRTGLGNSNRLQNVVGDAF